jgi:hypothetical protein
MDIMDVDLGLFSQGKMTPQLFYPECVMAV